MPGKSKEEVVHEFRVQSIQDATMRVIARKGISAATMQEIADEAGVAKGTIYLYFRDRDELVEKTFENAMRQLHERTDAALAGDAPFATKLRAMLAAQMEFFRDHREFFRLYISMRVPEGNAQQQRRQKRTCQPQYRTRVERMANVLSEAMRRGEIANADAMRLAMFIIEGSSALMLERILEEAPPPERDDVELIATTVLDGLLLDRRPH